MTDGTGSFFIKGDFGPSEIALMSEAFEKACKSLHDRGQPDIVNEIIAERIIALAQRGEVDRTSFAPARLRFWAIKRCLNNRSKGPRSAARTRHDARDD